MRLVSTTLALAILVLGCSIGNPVHLLTGPSNCYAGGEVGHEGVLRADPKYGTVFQGVPVIWPVGFTGTPVPGGEVAVLNEAGLVVATTGKEYGMARAHPGDDATRLLSERGGFVAAVKCGAPQDFYEVPAETVPDVPPTQNEIREAAAHSYAYAVIETNRERNDVFQRYKNRSSLKDNKTYCWKLAYVERDFLTALHGVTYPDDAAADARALILDVGAQVAALRTCAKAPNASAVNRAMDLANKARDRAHEASNLVTLDLGLDPLPG